jgi:hypothetical protein
VAGLFKVLNLERLVRHGGARTTAKMGADGIKDQDKATRADFSLK